MSKRREFTAEFKRDAASLVVDQGYSIKEACRVVEVGDTAMRRWASQLRAERQGITPSGSKALTEEQKAVQELEYKVRQLEMEKDILKKATALLIVDGRKL